MAPKIGESLFNVGVVLLIGFIAVPARGQWSRLEGPVTLTRLSVMKEPVHLTDPQVSLLTSAAVSLGSLKESFESKAVAPNVQNFGEGKQFLLDTLVEGANNAKTTQANFEKLASSEESRRASEVFFGDLLDRYHFNQDRAAEASDANSYRAVRNNTLLLLDYNHVAYTTVATQESLTFDLEVNSSPPNATISFKRDGDATYTTQPSLTDTEIKNLVYAVWFVRVELKGYAPKEKQYNAFRETQHVVSFDLH